MQKQVCSQKLHVEFQDMLVSGAVVWQELTDTMKRLKKSIKDMKDVDVWLIIIQVMDVNRMCGPKLGLMQKKKRKSMHEKH